jgi:MFS family permease
MKSTTELAPLPSPEGMSVPDAPAVRQRRNPFINRNFALLWLGTSISFIGDQVLNATLLVWISLLLLAGQTWAPLAVSGLLIAAATPVLLVGPIAGALVDRWDKRQTILRVTLAQALVMLALLVVLFLAPWPLLVGQALPAMWQLGIVYAAVFLVNALNQFVDPAALSLVRDIVPAEAQAQATGLTQAMMGLAFLIGPAVGAPLALVIGPMWALLIDAVSFLLIWMVVRFVHAPHSARSVAEGQRGNVFREIGAALRFVATSRVIVAIVLGVSLVMLGIGAINTLDIFFVTQNLHVPGVYYGLVTGVIAAAGIAGAIVWGAVAERIGLVRMAMAGLLIMGLCVMTYSRMTQLVPALVVLIVAGLAQSATNVGATPILMRVTPPAMLGRVITLIQPVFSLMSFLGIALSGYLVSETLIGLDVQLMGVQFGPVDTLFLAGGALIAVGSLISMLLLAGYRLPAAASHGE